jgi:hypothetical protein
MDSRAADGSKSVLSAKRWFKGRNGTLTVVRIQRTYTRRAAKRSFKSGQAMVQVTWRLGGTGKAEAAKLPGAGIGPSSARKMRGRKRVTDLRQSSRRRG